MGSYITHRQKVNTCFWKLQGEYLPNQSQPGLATGLEENSSPGYPVFLLQDQATHNGQKTFLFYTPFLPSSRISACLCDCPPLDTQLSSRPRANYSSILHDPHYAPPILQDLQYFVTFQAAIEQSCS